MDELLNQLQEQVEAVRRWALVLEVSVVATAVLILVFGTIIAVLLRGVCVRLDRLQAGARPGSSPGSYGGPVGTSEGPAVSYGPMPRYGSSPAPF